jgi:hypothetical protein
MQPSTTAATITAVATIIAAVIGLLKFGGSARRSKVKHSTNSNIAIGDNINQTYQNSTYISLSSTEVGSIPTEIPSRPSLVEISDAINAAKPYDKIQISKNYVGLLISWPVVFFSFQKDDDENQWYVSFHSLEKHFVSVSTYIDIDKYPKFKVVDSGHRCWIKGRIESADSLGVHLEDDPDITLE